MDFKRVAVRGATNLVWPLPKDFEGMNDDQALDIGLIIQSMVNGTVEGKREREEEGKGEDRLLGIVVSLDWAINRDNIEARVKEEVRNKKKKFYRAHPMLARTGPLSEDNLRRIQGYLLDDLSFEQMADKINEISDFRPTAWAVEQYVRQQSKKELL